MMVEVAAAPPPIASVEEWRAFEGRAWYIAWRDRGLRFDSIDADEFELVRAYATGERLDGAQAIVDRYVALISLARAPRLTP